MDVADRRLERRGRRDRRDRGRAGRLPLRPKGRFTTTVRRSSRARWNARTVSVTASEAESSRAVDAPTAVAIAAWSTAKFDVGAFASAARTSIEVRLLAASVMPVIALVSPQP